MIRAVATPSTMPNRKRCWSAITGTVTESGSGDPLEGVTIQAQTGSDPQFRGGKQGVSDSSGHYFIDDVDPGSYQMNARKSGYQAKTQTVNVAGDSAQADLALDANCVVDATISLAAAPSTFAPSSTWVESDWKQPSSSRLPGP